MAVNCNLTTSSVEKHFLMLCFLGMEVCIGFFGAITQNFFSFHSLCITKTEQSFPSFLFWLLDVRSLKSHTLFSYLILEVSFLRIHIAFSVSLCGSLLCPFNKKIRYRILGYRSIMNVHSGLIMLFCYVCINKALNQLF